MDNIPTPEKPVDPIRYKKGNRVAKVVSVPLIEANKKNKSAKILGVRETRTGKIVVTPKMDLFLEEFLKNGGNATQAALVVFKCTSLA